MKTVLVVSVGCVYIYICVLNSCFIFYDHTMAAVSGFSWLIVGDTPPLDIGEYDNLILDELGNPHSHHSPTSTGRWTFSADQEIPKATEERKPVEQQRSRSWR